MHKTEPANSKGIIKAHSLQALKTLFGSKFSIGRQFVRVWRMQLYSHRYARITGLLSTPLDLRIGDWLYVLPAISLIVVKSKKVNKAASSDWWTAKPPRRKAHTIAFPLGRGERLPYAEFSHLIVLCIRCCVRATNTSVCIDSLDKHSIQCIACFDLCIDSVDKQDTLLNTQ